MLLAASKMLAKNELMMKELRKKDMLTGKKDFEMAVDNLVSSNKLELRGNDSNTIYFITINQNDTILVLQT